MRNGTYIHHALPPGYKIESFTHPDHPTRTKFAVIDINLDIDVTDWHLKEQKAIEDFNSCRKAN